MEERKDYYKILGISDEEKKLQGKEFAKILKPKYRNLAKKYHPDLVSGEEEKKKAEEKFKEIAEAYSVLSDEKKREEYDNPNSGFHFDGFSQGGMNMNDIFNNMGFGGFGDIFGDIFGHRNSNKHTVRKGQDVEVVVDMTLEELYNGTSKTITYNRLDTCPTCKGKGYGANGHKEDCKVCGGTGTIFRTIRPGAQTITACRACNGQGKKIVNPCSDCNGSGVKQNKATVTVQIPKGIFHGASMCVEGEGSSPLNGEGIRGNLNVVVRELPHEIFERHGDTLLFSIEVSVIDALLGCNKIVKTIDGKELSLKIPMGTEDGEQFRFSGKGMPNYQTGKYGNMIGIIKIKMPKDLTATEKSLLEQLKTQPHFNG